MAEFKTKYGPSDYEWAGVAEFYKWLAFRCDLVPINTDLIWSMRVSKGLRQLTAQKHRVVSALTQNINNIKMCLQDKEEAGMDEHMINLTHSLLNNYVWYLDIVRDQIASLENLRKYTELNIFTYEDFDEDEVPF